jgi:hypothetical protein
MGFAVPVKLIHINVVHTIINGAATQILSVLDPLCLTIVNSRHGTINLNTLKRFSF